jgi:hypothetical protein
MPNLTAAEISKLLRELALRLELEGGNPYRARAYSRAADNRAIPVIPVDSSPSALPFQSPSPSWLCLCNTNFLTTPRGPGYKGERGASFAYERAKKFANRNSGFDCRIVNPILSPLLLYLHLIPRDSVSKSD